MKNSPEKKRLKSIKGKVWQVGPHRIGCGDSTDKAFIAKLVSNHTIASVICDVPYGIKYTESKQDFADIKVKKNIQNDDITTDKDYVQFTQSWLSAIIPYLKEKNAVYIFNCDKMIFALREGMKLAGIKFAQLLVWVKNQPVIGRLDYLPQHELIAYGWYKKHLWKRAKDKSVLFYPRPNKSMFHPTTKPIALIQNLILNSSRVGDVVFDGFLGSGTTALACHETGRIFIGCELDPEYCNTILKRFEDRYGITAYEIA